MTFSIVVREPIDNDGTEHRFGVGVTTNNPGIGVFCPFVSEHAAVATQYQTHGEVGPLLLDLLDEGRRAEEVVAPAAATSPVESDLQIHALCSSTRGYFGGEGMVSFHEESEFDHGERSGGNWSVAGNCLADEAVLEATTTAYEESDRARPLAVRLLDAIEAGDDAGGDGRDNDARSAAIKVVDPSAGIANEWYNDLRVGAAETPIADLRAQYELAKDFHADASQEW